MTGYTSKTHLGRKSYLAIIVLLVFTLVIPMALPSYAEEDIEGSDADIQDTTADIQDTTNPAAIEAVQGVLENNNAVDIGNVLNNGVIALKPTGLLREANVNSNAAKTGNRLHLYNQGSSSKNILTWDEKGGYMIENRGNSEKKRGNSWSYWDVDDQSKKDGAVVHVWSKNGGDNKSQRWTFLQNSDGTYYIKNVNSGLYLSLQDLDPKKIDSDNNKLVQRTVPMSWDLTILTILDGLDGKNVKSGAIVDEIIAQYSTYAKELDWMSKLDGSRLLSDITIPGTHDTGTVNIQTETDNMISNIKTQKYYIDEQLRAGVRSFDIRCAHAHNVEEPKISHGTFACESRDGEIYLNEVMDTFVEYLDLHPSEVLLISIKTENDGKNDDITKYIDQNIKKHPDKYWGKSSIPTVDEARGKIVFIRRYELVDAQLDEGAYGVYAGKAWDGNLAVDDKNTAVLLLDDKKNGVMLYVQDKYVIGGGDKLKYIRATLDQAKHLPANAYLFNYMSCTLVNPLEAAQKVTREMWTNDHFSPSNNASLGVIVMDFIDAGWARKIYETNFTDTVDLNPNEALAQLQLSLALSISEAPAPTPVAPAPVVEEENPQTDWVPEEEPDEDNDNTDPNPPQDPGDEDEEEPVPPEEPEEENPGCPGCPECPGCPYCPGCPEPPETPEIPETPETPEPPETPETPGCPGCTGCPGCPCCPETPEPPEEEGGSGEG